MDSSREIPVDQMTLITAWISSDDARHSAQRLIARYRLRIEPGDLLNDLWSKLASSLERRGEPYPDIADAQSAARFAYRSMDNLCRDMLRSARRRGELVPMEDDSIEFSTMGGYSSVDQKILLEQLLFSVGAVLRSRRTCPGCPESVAGAVALETVHLMLKGDVGDESGRQWLDRLLYEALESVDPEHAERTAEARRQRKSRCGRCASEIITQGLQSMGLTQ